MAFFLSATRQITLKEYENYISSVQPIPLHQLQQFDKASQQSQRIFLGCVVLGLPISIFLLKIAFTMPFLTSLLLVLAALLLAVSPIIYNVFYQKKYHAKLIPFGLSINDICTQELTISEYRALSTITNPHLLHVLQQFIEFRGGNLLFVDYLALNIDEYFHLITPRQSDSHFVEKRNVLIDQILKKSKQVTL